MSDDYTTIVSGSVTIVALERPPVEAPPPAPPPPEQGAGDPNPQE